MSRRRRGPVRADRAKGMPDFSSARGAVHDMSDQGAALARIEGYLRQSAGMAVPLPRPPGWATAPFGPGNPLFPAPLDPVRPDSGRAEPRIYEYPVSWNLSGTSNRLTPWPLLRAAADGVSLFRRCIEIRKDHMVGLDWDIVIGQGAIESAQRAEGRGTGRAALEDKLRDRLTPEIDRAVSFLKVPDRGNGYEFAQWLSMLLEESFVLDAVAVYPRQTYGGELWSLEVLDGTTIKPLLDERGGRPLPPYPAFQQLLYGFPRGEFTASLREGGDGDGTQFIDGAYATDEMIYSRRVARVWTPYGYSAVEQALDDGDLYLKRHAWMKGEYTDGTSVAGLFKIDPSSGTGSWSPEQILQYERAWNDALAGQREERLKARLLPPGVEPAGDGNNLTAMAERYKPEYDLHLIKLLASHFDTTLPELGFTEAKGLGSDGYHEGQADVQHRKTRPIIRYVEALVTGLMRRHAAMPPELEFRFLGLDDEDDPGADDVEGKRQAQGVKTLNERRDDLGLPRYDFVEADMPMVLTGRGVVFLEGSSELGPRGSEIDPHKNTIPGDPKSDPALAGGQQPQLEGAQPPAKQKPAADDATAAKSAELAAYRRWQAKGAGKPHRRPFVFEHCIEDDVYPYQPPEGRDYVIKAGDADPKAPAPPGRQWPGWEHDLALVEYYAPRLRRALLSALRGTNTATALTRSWLASRTTETDLGEADARAWLDDRGLDLAEPLRKVLTELWTEAYLLGDRSAAAMCAGLLLQRNKAAQRDDEQGYEYAIAPDWGNWTPGDVRAALLMLGADGTAGEGLRALLEAAGVTIKSIADHRLDVLAAVLHQALAEGWSEGKLAKTLRAVLDDPRWARLVATTETARAQSQASLARYRDNNVEAKEWLSAEDVRVCKMCNENEGDGPIGLDAYFSSGDDAPPAHPDCRCAIAPAIAARSRVEAESGGTLSGFGLGFGDLIESVRAEGLAAGVTELEDAEL